MADPIRQLIVSQLGHILDEILGKFAVTVVVLALGITANCLIDENLAGTNKDD